MAAPLGATAVLRAAAAVMREDETGDAFLHAVMSMLENKAAQIDKHAARLVDPATPERVFADVYKVARTYLQVREIEAAVVCEQLAADQEMAAAEADDAAFAECTCGHYYSEHPCSESCGCTDG